MWTALLAAGLSVGWAQEEAMDTGELPEILALPELKTFLQPEYPAPALASGAEANVPLLLEIDIDGNVVYAEALEQVGNGFEASAVEAAYKWTFEPAQTAEGPVEVAFEFICEFALVDGEPVVQELPILVPPSVIEHVDAPYPTAALDAKAEGVVRVLVELSERGHVLGTEVLDDPGYGFGPAAKMAVEAMRFTPARTAAGAIPVTFEFEYTFTYVAPENPYADIVTMDGRLREMGTANPMAGATVVVVEAERTVVADENGKFFFKGIGPGTYTVRVLSTEHVTVERTVEVVDGEITQLDLWVRALSYKENEAIGLYNREQEEVTRRTVTMDEVRKVPGTFGDPVKVIQTLPGAARSPFGTGFLVIRGSNPEDSAVYVDGVRVPIIFHLTGTTSVLSPEIISAVDYLPGGYSVEYGRSTGGVVDVKTKNEFGDPKIIWSTDILDTQLYFEGEIGKKKKHGLALGARRSYIDAFIPLFTRGTDFTIRPIYWDYQIKWVPPTLDTDEASFFVYGFQDILRIATPSDVAQSSDQDTQGDLNNTYMSHRLAGRWKRTFSEKVSFEIQPSGGIDATYNGLGTEFKLNSTNAIFGLRSELRYEPHPAINIAPGLDFLGGYWSFDFASPLGIADLDDPLAEREAVGFTGRGTAWSPDPYLNLRIRPLGDRDRWLMTFGARLNTTFYTYGGSVTQGNEVEPSDMVSFDGRFSTRVKVVEPLVLKASTGLYHQPPQPFESIGLGTTSTLSAEETWQSTFGFEHQVTPAFKWEVEGFYRKMSDLVVFNNGFTGQSDEPFQNLGDGYAYGVEVIARHAPIGKFFGWISYTFSRSFRRDSPDQEFYPFNFDQPHILSAQAGYDLPLQFGISAQVQFVSGNPFTPANAGVYDVDGNFYNGFAIGPTNSERLPPFWQVSVRGDKTFTFRRWQLEIYADLMYVLRGVNPEATFYNYDFTEYAFVRGLPFIPNIGFEAKFWP